jgi:hypothetical protein
LLHERTDRSICTTGWPCAGTPWSGLPHNIESSSKKAAQSHVSEKPEIGFELNVRVDGTISRSIVRLFGVTAVDGKEDAV